VGHARTTGIKQQNLSEPNRLNSYYPCLIRLPMSTDKRRAGIHFREIGADARPFALSVLLAFSLLLLLALQSRPLAARFLTNLAALTLLPRWQVVAQSLALPPCPEGSPPAGRGLDAALRLAPQDGRAWLQKGRALWLEGRCAEAVEAWQRAVARNPRDAAPGCSSSRPLRRGGRLYRVEFHPGRRGGPPGGAV
jgi:tetratricopeptide (TPR) repeat protein